MGRSPCCDKKGLKKGPWIPEEDQVLISYIQRHGHGNWRALPKQAGLLRCGKSCRLRWTNYLRPDIKRGNFTAEEEETIMKSHQMLGNRWSAIAAKLPGRTDNEIKNHWRTHLMKRLSSDTTTVNTDAAETHQISSHQGERVDCDSVHVEESTTKSTAIPEKESESKSESNAAMDSEGHKDRGNQDERVDYDSVHVEGSTAKSTAIPEKELESKSVSNPSMGSEGHKDRGNAKGHKDSGLSNEDFWAEVLSETSFSIEEEGGFEAQSSSTLLASNIFDVTQAWALEEEEGTLDYIWD